MPLSLAGRAEVRCMCHDIGKLLRKQNVTSLRMLCVAPGEPAQETARMLLRGVTAEEFYMPEMNVPDGSIPVGIAPEETCVLGKTEAWCPELKCRKLKTVDAFANLNQGLWQGMLIEDIRRSQPKIYRLYQESPECICPPEGESIPEARTRVRPVLEKLLRQMTGSGFPGFGTKSDEYDVIGIVVSAPIARIIREYLGYGELDDLWETLEEHGRWELLLPAAKQAVA